MSLLEDFGTKLQAAQSGYAILLVFGGGVLSSLTPCVYPLIPITLSIFGAAGEVTRARGFLLSLCYVLGIATTYTALGMLSATSGVVFGSFLGNPWVVTFISLLLIALALATLDLWTFRLGGTAEKFCQRAGGTGFRGAYVMGLVSGVIAAPCVGPVLVAILVVASAAPNPAWGGLLLFSYAMGLGLPFLVLGTFSGLISRLPRSGPWLSAVKFLLAAATLAIAVFFALPLVERAGFSLPHLPLAASSTAVLAALVVGLIAARRQRKRSALGAAVALAIFAHMLVFESGKSPHEMTAAQPSAGQLAWKPSIPEAVEEARARQTIAMVDLFAEWCAACKELDKITFADPEVRRELGAIALGRVDFTTETDVTSAIAEKYGVIGLPSVMFLRADGTEIPNSRISGFLPPAAFLNQLADARATR